MENNLQYGCTAKKEQVKKPNKQRTEHMKHLNLELERLEQRIAPGGAHCGGGHGSKGGGSKSGHSAGGGSKSGGSKSGGSKSGGSKCSGSK